MTRNRSMLSSWPRQSAAAASAGLLLLVISVWAVHVLCWQGSSTDVVFRQTVSTDPLPARLPPLYQMIEGQEVVYERLHGAPKGILALFHGCQHSATDFWSKQSACATCIGLPEEKRIVHSAIARQYVPIAFSSMNRGGSRCWDAAPPPTVTLDVQKVLHSLDVVRDVESWQHLPVYALGASSGGAFVLLLPFHLQLQGAIIQIMGVPNRIWSEHLPSLKWQYPPAAFVHMPRDTRTAAIVADNVDALGKAGIPTVELRVEPAAMTPATFAQAIEEVDMQMSERIYKAFKDGDMLDANDRLQHDPRKHSQEWQALLLSKIENVSAIGPLEPDRSFIHEELNVLWAGTCCIHRCKRHEIVASATDGVMDWFESQMKSNTS